MRSVLGKVTSKFRALLRLKAFPAPIEEKHSGKHLVEWEVIQTWMAQILGLVTWRTVLTEDVKALRGLIDKAVFFKDGDQRGNNGRDHDSESDVTSTPVNIKGPSSEEDSELSNKGSEGHHSPRRKHGNDKVKFGRDLFKMFVEEDGRMAIYRFIEALKLTGIRMTDPRLKNLATGLKITEAEGCALETDRVSLEEFMINLDLPAYSLLSKAFRHNLVVRDFPALCKIVQKEYQRLKSVEDGKVADYIPQLSLMPADNFGVSICTIDGQRYSIGDVNVPFTIQSMSKPLTYALCLENLGPNVVHKYVGQEPSGRIFNELILDNNNRPHNPMVNAGAIVICSLLLDLVQPKLGLAEKYDLVMSFIKRLAGGEHIGFNNAVFVSERDAANRNYAIAFLLREHRCFPPNVDLRSIMDFYFQCCSLEGNCESLAVVSATLANGGTCPLTGEKILSADSVRDTLSLMQSCGMYDYSGQFAFKDFVSKLNFHPYGIWNKTDVNQNIFDLKKNKILNAAYIGDHTTIERFLKDETAVSQCDRDGRTPLHIAATEGHYELAEILIKYGGKDICCVRDRFNLC